MDRRRHATAGPVEDAVCFQPQGSRHSLRPLFCFFFASYEKNRRTARDLPAVIALRNGCYQPLTSIFYLNPTFATRGIEAAKLEVFRGVRSKGRHHAGRCHGAATSTEAILGDG